MAASVTNTVSTVFTVNDKASAAILRIANAANSAAGAVARMQSALRGAASVNFATVAPNLRAAASAAAAYNAQLRAMAPMARVASRTPVVAPSTVSGAGGGRGLAFGPGRAIQTAASAYYLARNIGADAVEASKAILDLHEKYEDMRHTFAGQIESLGMAKSFSEADAQAGLLMTRLRQMAAKLPGDMNYYAQMVQEASTSLFRAGVPDMEGVLSFMGKYGATVYSIAARHKDLGVGARELFAMVGGVARRQMPLFNYLSQYMDRSVQSVEKFNKLNPAERFKQLEKALEGFKGATATTGELVSAKLGELRDRIAEIVRVGSLPIFERAKIKITEINEYLSNMHARYEGLVRVLSENLYEVLRLIGNTSQVIVSLLEQLPLEDLKTSLWAINNIMEKMGENSSKFVMNLISSIPVINSALAPIKALALFGPLTERRKEMEAQAESTRRVAAVKDVSDAVLNNLIEQTLPTDMSDTLMEIARLAKMPGVYSRDLLEKFAVFKGYTKDQLQELIGFEKPGIDLTAKAPEDRSKVNYDFRYSRFDIRQNFAEGFDPDRIAVAFATDLARLSDMKLGSAMSPVTGGLSQGGF